MIVAGSANPLLLSSAGGYNLTRSLRFRSSASAFLNRTPVSSGSQTTYTYSAWVKRGILSSANYLVLWSSESSGANYTSLVYYADAFYWATNGTILQSTAVYRDTSAWYHIVLAVDTTQATSTNRVKIYVNGSQVTLSGSYPTLNQALQINTSSFTGKIGFGLGFGQYFDGYMAEINFIDGQALTPSSFGSTNAQTGVWQPAKYTGTYGTNGFYLPFTDNSALTTSSNVGLGRDYSGNGNYWTTNNISITAGATYDSMTDVPTLTSATTANYAVLNPLTTKIDLLGVATLSNGNLQATSGGSNAMLCIGSIFITSGKWYAECTVTTSLSDYIGLASQTNANSTASGTGAYSYTNAGTKASNGSSSAYGATYTTGDVIGVAYDADAGTLTFYKNGTSQGTAYSGINVSVPRTFASFNAGTGTYVHNWNFGQRPFAYTPPSGFVALNTFNLPTPTIGATASTRANKYMDAVLYSGNNSTQNIAVGFQPDFVWSKCRNVGRSHRLSDAVRGSTRDLYSDTTSAEQNDGSITSFISTGFSLNNATGSTYNTSGENYVSWAWRASNAAGVSNTQGTITSTVSANTTAGFSIVTYTGNATSGATVGHGLGVAPRMIIAKNRSSGVTDWPTYHISTGNNGGCTLNETAAKATTAIWWNNTTPSSSVVTLGSGSQTNGSGNAQVLYCFAEIAGYSRFGSYTGNGSTDGPFVFTEFRPKFVLIKRTDGGTANWYVLDSARNTFNLATNMLFPNLSAAEATTAEDNQDFLSNGFKVRTSNQESNINGGTYIYMAFAESPFKYSNAR